MKTYAYAVIAIVLLLMSGGGAFAYWYHGHEQYKAGQADQLALDNATNTRAIAAATAHAAQVEAAMAAHYAAIDAQHVKDMNDAKTTADRTIADLRAGNLRLRDEWTCPTTADVPATAASATGPDAAAQLRFQGATDLVQSADDADAEVRALQAVIRADRAATPDAGKH